MYLSAPRPYFSAPSVSRSEKPAGTARSSAPSSNSISSAKWLENKSRVGTGAFRTPAHRVHLGATRRRQCRVHLQARGDPRKSPTPGTERTQPSPGQIGMARNRDLKGVPDGQENSCTQELAALRTAQCFQFFAKLLEPIRVSRHCRAETPRGGSDLVGEA